MEPLESVFERVTGEADGLENRAPQMATGPGHRSPTTTTDTT